MSSLVWVGLTAHAILPSHIHPATHITHVMDAQETLTPPADSPQPAHTPATPAAAGPSPGARPIPESRPPAGGDAPAGFAGAPPPPALDDGKTDDPEPRGRVHTLVFCSATTRRGSPCSFAARKATGLCVNHDPSYREQQAENSRRGMETSLRRRRDRPTFIPLETLDLSTRGGVQAAIEALLHLELSGRISPARSRNIARTLSLALRTQGHEWDWRTSHGPAYRDARTRTLASLPLIAHRLAADSEAAR